MSTNCDEFRDRLTATGDAGLSKGLAGHARECPACDRYASRARAARQLIRNHQSSAEPDAAFAARVVERLRHERDETLGWAAVRLLPATVAVLVILAWVSLQVAPDPRSLLVQSPTDDLVSWAIELTEEGS